MAKIDSGEKLQMWINQVDRKLDLLTTDVEKASTFNINKNEYKDINSETWEASDYRLAKFFHAVMNKDKATIIEMGGQNSPRNFGRGKADLGTPLTGKSLPLMVATS